MVKCDNCGREKVLLVYSDGKKSERNEICSWCSLSESSKKELEEIKKKVDKTVKPLYDALGINMETESLVWANNEVFVRDKKTNERREITGLDQKQLNTVMFSHAINFAKEMDEQNV